jgi:hypothetical protein
MIQARLKLVTSYWKPSLTEPRNKVPARPGTLERAGAKGYPETARGRGTGMVMGHSAAPATVSQPAPAGSSGCWLPGSEVAISVPVSVLGKAVLKIRV